MLTINHALYVIAYFCIVHLNNTNYPEKNQGQVSEEHKASTPTLHICTPVCQIIVLILNNQYPLQLSIVFFI